MWMLFSLRNTWMLVFFCGQYYLHAPAHRCIKQYQQFLDAGVWDLHSRRVFLGTCHFLLCVYRPWLTFPGETCSIFGAGGEILPFPLGLFSEFLRLKQHSSLQENPKELFLVSEKFLEGELEMMLGLQSGILFGRPCPSGMCSHSWCIGVSQHRSWGVSQLCQHSVYIKECIFGTEVYEMSMSLALMRFLFCLERQTQNAEVWCWLQAGCMECKGSGFSWVLGIVGKPPPGSTV